MGLVVGGRGAAPNGSTLETDDPEFMLVRSIVCISLILAALIFQGAIGLPSALGQTDRLRTLVYDPAAKDWIEQPPPPTGTAERDLYDVRVLIRDQKYRQALASLDAFDKGRGIQHALYSESLILRAQALVGQKRFEDAHEVLQKFLSEFRGMELTGEALRLEFVVAEAFLAGAKRRFLRIFKIKDVDFGYRILDEISTDYPDSPLAELALKRKGDHLASVGEHDLAELEYARMLRDYPRSRYHEYALARTAESALASFGGVEFDEAALIEAEERYRDYLAQYAVNAERAGVKRILEGINETKAEKDFQIGAYYERTDHVGSAVYYYRFVLEEYPGSIASVKARERLELIGVLEPIAATNTPPTGP